MPTTNLGLPLIAGNMNADVVRDVNALAEGVDLEVGAHLADYVKHSANGGITAGTATAYTCNSSLNPPSLVDKMGLVITAHIDSGANPTLKWGTLAAKSIKKPNGNAATLKKDGLYTLRYNSVNDSFILQGEGGEYGTVTAGDVLSGVPFGTENGVIPGTLALTGDALAPNVLSGKTFYNTNAKSKATGTMSNYAGQGFDMQTWKKGVGGAPSDYIQVYPKQAGYYDLNSYLQINDADLQPGNIKAGVNIFDVIGTLTPGSAFTATPGDIVLVEASGEKTNTTTTFTKVKDIQVRFNGVIRVKFDFRSTTNSNVEAAVYKNGVRVGIVRIVSASSETTFSEDFSVVQGDYIQLYIRAQSAGANAAIRNFKICGAEDPLSSIILA